MNRFFSGLHKCVSAVVIILFALLAAITFLQVVLRYLFNAPIFIADELLRYLFIWGILLGAGLGLSDKTHIRIDYLRDRLPARYRRWLDVLIWAGLTAFSVLLVVVAVLLAGKVAGTRSSAMGISIAWLYASVAMGATVWSLFSARNLYGVLRGEADAEGEQV